MKIISFNVNGIRSLLKKGFNDFVKKENPDVLCIQETKSGKDPIEVELEGYHLNWNHAKKLGYSGTLTISKSKPLSVINDMGLAKHDQEGRIITTEFKDFYVVNVYVPNAKRDLSRLDYRSKEWDVDFLAYLKNLEKKKPIVFCGDMNVAHQPLDLSNPKGNERTHGFTIEERMGFDNVVKAGFIDTFREFEKGPGYYSWWSQMGNCRARNVGWRIDYVCISPALRARLKKAFILKEVMGSDHCPVGIEIL